MRTITLTDSAPVTIDDAAWPLIASATGRSRVNHGTPIPDYEVDKYSLRVRQHEDGRAIVYGVLDAATAWTGSEDHRGGYVYDRHVNLASAIRRVGRELGLPEAVIRDCIADLPAVALV